MKLHHMVLALLASLAGARNGVAASVVIAADQDNTLYYTTDGSLSNGAGQSFFAGCNGDGQFRRGLVQFDVASAIPSGATITGVTLTLHMSRTVSGPQPVNLHRVLAAWGEGDSVAPGAEGGGAPSAPNDATWMHTFYSTQFWTTPGGDFDSTASATASIGGVGFYSWSAPGLVADVQSWLDTPSLNHGWLLLGDETSAVTTKRFDTRENSNVAQRPALEVQFVPEPHALALLIAVLGLLRGSVRT